MHLALTSKGQITIPAATRRKMRLKAGDKLDVYVTKNLWRASDKIDVERMRSVIGRGRKALRGKTTEQWMEWLRGPVELP